MGEGLMQKWHPMEGTGESGGIRSQAEYQHPSMVPTHRPWLNQTLQPQFPRIGSAPALLGPFHQINAHSPMALSTPHSRPAPSGQASPNGLNFTTFNNNFIDMMGTVQGTSGSCGAISAN